MDRVRRALAANPLAVDAVIAVGLTALSLFALGAGATDLGPAGPVNVSLLLLQHPPARRAPPLPDRGHGRGRGIHDHPGLAPARRRAPQREPRHPAGRLLHDRRAAGTTDLGAPGSGVVRGPRHCYRSAPGHRHRAAAADPDRADLPLPGSSATRCAIRRLYTRTLEEQARLLEREREERARRAVDGGARADRPRAARRGDPPRQRDRHPGRRRAARARPAPGGCARPRWRPSTPPRARR